MRIRIRTTIIPCAAGVLLFALLQPSAIFAQGGQEQADTAASHIELRFARQTPAPDFRRLTMPRSGHVVYVDDESVLTDEDFEHVRAVTTPDGLVLTARWKPGSAQRLAEIQRGDVGAGSDLLALFIEGELVSAPRIRVESLADLAATPTIDIAVPVPADRAERIAELVAAHWPGGS